ncbi:BOS complex subunit NCLN-like protein [Drosera capensis]
MSQTTARSRSQLLDSTCCLLTLLVLLFASIQLCGAATVVDVYRLIQYDLAGVPFGSRFSNLNHHAGSSIHSNDSDLSRTVLIFPIRDLDLDLIKDYVVKKRQLGGMLFLLPRVFRFGREGGSGGDEGQKDGVARSKLLDLERLLVHASLSSGLIGCWFVDVGFIDSGNCVGHIVSYGSRYPVYFAFEDENVEAILAEVKRSDASGQPATATNGGYKLVVSTTEPKKVVAPIITNIQGWLLGQKADEAITQLPTIAIAASYDTFGAAPALSTGSDSNGSGVVALLEIARLFSLLYSNPKTRGKYNLLFALTSGGPYNYNGTQKWLRGLDQRVHESIDYAICLNSIGSWDNELWIHVSKPPENAFVKQIFEGFSDAAGDLGFKVDLKHKKINISNPRVAWEHEQFSRLRITALTLSELSAAPLFLENFGALSDSRHFVQDSAITKSVKLVAESLAKHIYGHQGKNIQFFAENSSVAINPSYISSWLDLLSRISRVAPFLPKGDPFINALKRELEEHVVEVSAQHETLDGIFTFYDSTKAILTIYQVASVTFDLLLLLLLGSYLIVLFSFLVITTRGLDDLISLFRRPPSRKVKTA